MRAIFPIIAVSTIFASVAAYGQQCPPSGCGNGFVATYDQYGVQTPPQTPVYGYRGNAYQVITPQSQFQQGGPQPFPQQ